MAGAIVSGGGEPDGFGGSGASTPLPRGSVHQPGPGWWRASDGLYYPPEAHPNYLALQEAAAREAQHADLVARQSNKRVTSWTGVERFTVLRALVGVVILVAVFVIRIVGLSSSGDPALPPISQPSPEEVQRAIDHLNTMGNSGGTGGVYADTPVEASDGVIVFEDDFTDPVSGWPTVARPDGVSVGYAPLGGFAIASPTAEPVAADAPVEPGYVDLMISATGSATGAQPTEAAFGVSCGQSAPDRDIAYQFRFEDDGHWSLVRRESDDPADGGIDETRLEQGNAASPIDGVPTTVRLMCSRLGFDSTRLVAFLGDETVADLIDSAVLPTRFWTTGLVGAGEGATATVSRYEERDLGVR